MTPSGALSQEKTLQMQSLWCVTNAGEMQNSKQTNIYDPPGPREGI